jgi:hypothetical protein
MRGSGIASKLIVVTVAAGLLGVACSSGENNPSMSPSVSADSIQSLIAGLPQLQLLSTETPVNPGPNRFAFALTNAQGGLATGGSPQVYLAKDQTQKALGPYKASWYAFTGYGETGDTSPQTNLSGTYSVQVEIPEVGNWAIAVVAGDGSQRFAATGSLQVTDQPIPAAVGSKAISAKSPVATSDAKIAEICTRKPADKMHYISLDNALRNGKPTVVNFGTPLLCESRLCGPVIDEQILVFEKYGADRANFVHVEEFLPGPDLQPPSATEDNISPAFKAWGFQSEPWILVIDAKGIITARFEGPVTAPEIEAVLEPLV